MSKTAKSLRATLVARPVIISARSKLWVKRTRSRDIVTKRYLIFYTEYPAVEQVRRLNEK